MLALLRHLAVPTFALLTLFSAGAQALAPMIRPEPAADILPGRAEPYIGAWSVTLPTREPTEPNTALAICALPVRIEKANDTHIFYLGPREQEADAAIELVVSGDGTHWQPIAGGPAFFAIWVNPDSFFLYDAVAEGEPDWSQPYIYNRCD
jgi:hypothetical protein